MLVLALLFIVIIGLLWVIVWLLQKYFEMYVAVRNGDNDTSQLQFQVQKDITSRQEINKKVDRLINERLTEMEAKFPTEQTQEEPLELLTRNFKKAVHSTLSLLKTEQYEAKP